MKNSHLDFSIAFCLVVFVMMLAVLMSGCGVKQPGSRTFNFGPDGATITSETTELPADQMVESKKEETRQVCYKQLGAKKAKIEQLAESQPLVYALIAQTDAINNAVSLAVTRKPYDPCPSSTNSSDVAIADSAMYTSIYKEAFSMAKFIGGAWLAKEAFDGITGAIAKAGSTTLLNSGEGTINIADSYKNVTLGTGATTGDILSNSSRVENILPVE